MKIFISHSSNDRQFANKLGVDLISAGLPIWLDIMELDVGDSLYKKIFEGLDSSNFVIIVISKSYNKTIWTSKEFRAILSKEDQEKRKIILPIIIDDTSIPIEINDRFYLRFSKDYEFKLNKLIRFFYKSNISIKSLPVQERLIPLRFNNYIELDKLLLITILSDRKAEELISRNQLWFIELDKIDEIKLSLKNKIREGAYNNDIKKQFDKDILQLNNLINILLDGIILALNSYGSAGDIHLISQSLYWFGKYIMESIYSILLRYSDLLEFDIDLKHELIQYGAFSDSISLCKFYGLISSRSLVIFDHREKSNYLVFQIDKENYTSKQLDEIPFPDSMISLYDTDMVYKYLIPQNIFQHLINPDKIKLMNEFEKYQIGIN